MTSGILISKKVWSRKRIFQTVLLAGLVLFIGCSKDSVGPKNNGDGYPAVFSADAGFVITQEMLDRRYNEITFPGTHNSTTYGFIPDCRNQDRNILQQLENGIRYIEFDVNDVLNICHGDCHSDRTMKSCLNDIKNYAAGHPNQVITVRISDLCLGLGASESYHRINGQLEPNNSNLGAYIYNWNPDKPKDDPGRCYIPDPWPTLREMIESGKNVMFIHHRDYKKEHSVDEAYVRKLVYGAGSVVDYKAKEQEQFCRLMPSWSSARDRQNDGPNRLFLIECCPDAGAVSGDKKDAAKNNDGRRLYQVAKQHEDEILPDNRVVNFITVDYFMTSHAKHLPVDVVDACNRLNHERFGTDWESSVCFWELYPNEFDDSKVEHISQTPAIQEELAEVVSDFKAELDLDGHEDKGKIVSTTYQTEVNCDWKRLPEWAVDNDLWTRWCGSSSRDNHTWGIDLGERRPTNEIAIAWEFSHRRPAYSVYASNNDEKFADGISNNELLNNTGWQYIAHGGMQTDVYPQLWDIQKLGEKPTVQPDYTNLLAGQNIDAGDVGFEIIDGELLVTYTSTGGWMMNTLHLWIGCDSNGYPQTRSGNPKIGHFPYVFDVAGDTSHTFIIDLNDPALESCLGTIDCENGNLFYAMAHAEMFKDDGFSGETGWADGNPAGGRNWATMVALTVDCVSSWRYFKIKVTDADSDHWPSFWEVKLYGPAK